MVFEKVAQMIQVSYVDVGREEALRWAKLGAGSFLHVLGMTLARFRPRPASPGSVFP